MMEHGTYPPGEATKALRKVLATLKKAAGVARYKPGKCWNGAGERPGDLAMGNFDVQIDGYEIEVKLSLRPSTI
jgi:hypothetical protein